MNSTNQNLRQKKKRTKILNERKRVIKNFSKIKTKMKKRNPKGQN